MRICYLCWRGYIIRAPLSGKCFSARYNREIYNFSINYKFIKQKQAEL